MSTTSAASLCSDTSFDVVMGADCRERLIAQEKELARLKEEMRA